MQRPFAILPLTLLAATLAACSQNTTRRAALPPLYVPSAMIAQAPDAPPAANAYAVLPSSDAFDLWVPRADKAAWGPVVMEQSSSYSIYTYDQQLISNLWGPSYRYRSIVQEGITIP